MSLSEPIVQLRGIRKAFPGVVALDGVDFTLRKGEIHALMGENGAGKSTLIKVLTGVHRRDEGSIVLDQTEIFPKTPLDAQELGISTVYQEVNLIPTLSVAENILLGRQKKKLAMVDWKDVHVRAEAALERLDVKLDTRENLSSYSIALQQLVAIARALDREAKVLVLDEPTSSLDKDEVERLFRVMRKLSGEGLGIVFVSHFLDQIYAISDRMTILRNGKLVGEYETASLPRLSLVAKMLGRSEEEVEKSEQHSKISTQSEPIMEGRDLERRGAVGPVDISVSKGEVVGLAGLLGSGRTETARLLFGLDKRDRGTLTLEGKPINLKSPGQGMRARIGFVPEDRKVEGIIPNLSVRENIVLALQARTGWLRKISIAKQRALADQYIKALRIATPNAETAVGQLSGGNQQKVVLARWLASQPRVLILDEPTRGVDIGAKAEIETIMSDLCGEGLAIILVATELEEVVRDSHRVVVMRDRKKVAELEGDQIQIDNIMQIIAGVA